MKKSYSEYNPEALRRAYLHKSLIEREYEYLKSVLDSNWEQHLERAKVHGVTDEEMEGALKLSLTKLREAVAEHKDRAREEALREGVSG